MTTRDTIYKMVKHQTFNRTWARDGNTFKSNQKYDAAYERMHSNIFPITSFINNAMRIQNEQ